MSWRWFVVWSVGVWAACGGGGFEGLHFPSTGREPGSRAFVSADDALSRPWPTGAGKQPRRLATSMDRLYRPLPRGRLLHLSHQRGLEILDVSDPTAPSLLGGLFLWGDPVDAWVIGETAHLLLGCAVCYLTGADGRAVELLSTSWLLTIDLSDPTRPREVDRKALPGRIVGSRLAPIGGQDVLQVGSDRWWDSEHEGAVSLRSFVLAPDGAREMGTRVLSSGRPLLVGGGAWFAFEEAEGHTTLRALSVDGEGARLDLAGWLQHAHVADGILHAVSWKYPDFVLETFDLSDPRHPKAVGRMAVEEASRVVFREGAVFAVGWRSLRVYLVSKPGAVAAGPHLVAPEGFAFEAAHLLSGGTRLLAFLSRPGELVVRLYDVSDPSRGVALLDEAGGLPGWFGTSSGWDFAGVTFLDEGGPATQGRILLPFHSVYTGRGRRDGVQLLSWSEGGLSVHGILETEDRPWSLLGAHGLVFIESNGDLLLFDTSEPDRPQRVGTRVAPPWVEDVAALGSLWVGSTWRPEKHTNDLLVWDGRELISQGDIPRQSELRSLGGTRLAVVHTTWHGVQIQIFVLEEGGWKARGELFLDRLGKNLGWPAGVPWDGQLLTVGTTLVFVSEREDTEVVGEETFCTEWPNHSNECLDGVCDVSGYRECVTRGNITRCEGGFSRCDSDGSCVEIRDIDTDMDCRPREVSRTTRAIEIWLVDTEDPHRPILREIVRLPADEEASGWFADGSDLWLSSKKRLSPHVLDTPLARFYTRRIDLSDPSAPAVGPPINVPGEVVVAAGNQLVTRDRHWNDLLLEEGLAILRLEGNQAVLELARKFPSAALESAHPDGRGRLAVGLTSFENGVWEGRRTLRWIGAADLSDLDRVDLPEWARLGAAAEGKTLVEVPHGVVVYEPEGLEGGATPVAFVPLFREGLPFQAAGDTLLFPAGRYGLQSVGPDTAGLPQAP